MLRRGICAKIWEKLTLGHQWAIKAWGRDSRLSSHARLGDLNGVAWNEADWPRRRVVSVMGRNRNTTPSK